MRAASTFLSAIFLLGCTDGPSVQLCENKPLPAEEESVLREIIRLNSLDTNLHRVAVFIDDDGCDFGYVRAISIRNKEIDSIPPTINKLPKVREIFLNNNNLTSLPNEITELTNLSSLDIGYNKICDPSKELEAWAEKLDPSWRSTQICD